MFQCEFRTTVIWYVGREHSDDNKSAKLSFSIIVFITDKGDALKTMLRC